MKKVATAVVAAEGESGVQHVFRVGHGASVGPHFSGARWSQTQARQRELERSEQHQDPVKHKSPFYIDSVVGATCTRITRVSTQFAGDVFPLATQTTSLCVDRQSADTRSGSGQTPRSCRQSRNVADR